MCKEDVSAFKDYHISFFYYLPCFVCLLPPSLKIQFVLINRLSGPVSLAYMCRDLCVLSVYFLLVIFKRLTCLGASLMALRLNR